MRKFRNKLLTAFLSINLLMLTFAAPAYAQDNFGICSLLGPIGQPFGCNADGTGTFGSSNVIQDYVMPRAQFILSLLFIGLILFSVIYVVRAAIIYIQSQGNPEKIGEATKSIRSVFVGLGALFVGIAGILLVLAFFGGTQEGGVGNFDVRCIERPQCCSDGTYNQGTAPDGTSCP